MEVLQHPVVYAALGDSMSIDDYAGGPGRGAASLLWRNRDRDFPGWAGRDLTTHDPTAARPAIRTVVDNGRVVLASLRTLMGSRRRSWSPPPMTKRRQRGCRSARPAALAALELLTELNRALRDAGRRPARRWPAWRLGGPRPPVEGLGAADWQGVGARLGLGWGGRRTPRRGGGRLLVDPELVHVQPRDLEVLDLEAADRRSSDRQPADR
jgi:hypothetical protein